ncbi:MAG: lytic transglycosylase domain-containing protein [Treponema sp.]|nr:lytic transglycosylase domain-containing protein [Treponema sp.]
MMVACSGEGTVDAESPEAAAEAKTPPATFFYDAVLLRSRDGPEAEVHALFEKSLSHTSLRVREEAARALIQTVLSDADAARRIIGHYAAPPEGAWERSLYGAALYHVGRFGEAFEALAPSDTPWALAIGALARVHHDGNKEALLTLLMDGAIDSAYSWAANSVFEGAEILNKAESAALQGRLLAARYLFKGALGPFRVVLEQNQQLFWQYPALLNDLGRSFQSANIPEGVSTFRRWEALLQAGGGDTALPNGDLLTLRYRIYYFLGRLERQRTRYTEASDYFRAALALAPDMEQEDACIWYLLSLTFAEKPEEVPAMIALYQGRWHDGPYFNDILSPLCRHLIENRQWDALLDVFLRIRSGTDREIIAQYAYILGRALDEGYLPRGATERALRAAGMSTEGALEHTFYRIAFEEAQASLYYRALSASRLKTAVELAPPEPAAENAVTSDDLSFLLGFFDVGAGELALPFLNRMRDTLPAPELRRVAQALFDHEQFLESIRLVNFYMNRRDYALNRADIALYYPRPFRDIIEKSAGDMDIPPQLLYGLIRTESAFAPAIASHAGAVGLAQLMPATALAEARTIAKKGGPDYVTDGTVDIEDPSTNVHIGASYLKSLINSMESPMLALLGYNGGPTRVKRLRNAEKKLPADLFLETISITETRNYGKRVSAAAAMYGYLYFDLSMERVVADIFK